MSSQFLDRYLETLDPQHIHFTQADLAEFERYRTNLNRLTQHRPPAQATRGRLAKSSTVSWNGSSSAPRTRDELLKNEKFTFDTDERITINRKQMPYPADLDEAKKLWRERLRFEYLQELLGKIGARKKNLAAATKNKPLSAETNALVRAPGPSKAAGRTDRNAVSPAVPAGPHGEPARPGVAISEGRRAGTSRCRLLLERGARKRRKPRRRGRSAQTLQVLTPWWERRKAERGRDARRAAHQPDCRGAAEKDRRRGNRRDPQPPVSPQPAVL